MQLLHGERHLLGGGDEEGGEPDGGGVVLLRGVEDRADRDLLAEVDDRVAVVGEDRVDERLADVVHVAEHGREHDGALRVALDLVEVLLELRDGLLHDLGALEHERQDQLAGAELVADLLHGRQQDVVERRDGADLLDAGVDLRLHALLLAAQDVPVEGLLGLHAGGRVGRLGGLLRLALVVGDEALQRVVAAVEDEVVGELALLLGDLRVRRDVVRVDHREIEPGLDAVVQEDGVEDRSRLKADAEAHVGDAEARLDARELLLDRADALDRLDRRRLPLVVAGREREGEGVEDQQLGVHPVLFADELRDALGDLELALARLGHANLVDGQRDQRGAVLHGDRHDFVELVAAGLEVDAVDDRAAGDLVERLLDHVGLRGVDLDRGRLGERDLLDHLAHLLVLVLALGERDADVEHVRAALDLVLGDLEQAVVVVGEEQLLGLAGALRVDALADQRRARLLDQGRGGDHRAHVRGPGLGPGGAVAALDALGERVDVIRRGAAAAADDVHPVALDELAEHGRDLLRRLREDRLAVRALVGDAGVGDAVDRRGRVLAEEADGVAHVLRAGGAVEADHVDLQRLERGESGADVGAQQHLAAVGEEADRGLDRGGAAGDLERLAGAEDRGLDLEDVLRGLDDDQVGAALEQALGLLGEDGDQLAEPDLAEAGVLGRREVAGGADRAGHEAVLADRLARDLGGLAVDLERVLAEAPLVELDAAGLERVGLHDLGAGIDHRRVDALDDVGAIEHERLVAAAGKLVVLLEREVELLERGAHPAVEDDDVVTDDGEEVTHDREG